MSSPLTQAVLKSGLITEKQLAEFRRWGVPIELPEKLPPPPKTIEDAASAIEEALESEGLVMSRDTDLDILHHYLRTQRPGHLHVEIPNEDVTLESSADIQVSFGCTPVGEYILPWNSESITSELTNGFTYLEVDGEKIFFESARDLFYGRHKAFIVCRPRQQPETQSSAGAPAAVSGEDHGSSGLS